jgi:hypothetical protein
VYAKALIFSEHTNRLFHDETQPVDRLFNLQFIGLRILFAVLLYISIAILCSMEFSTGFSSALRRILEGNMVMGHRRYGWSTNNVKIVQVTKRNHNLDTPAPPALLFL